MGIGLPSWPITDAGLSLLAGFLLLDLMRYLVHRCEHAVPLFWRFHALHHSDPDVDVTTAVRHHPIEYVLGSAVYWLAVIVLDIPAVVVISHGLAVFGTAAVAARQYSPARVGWSGGCSRCWSPSTCIASTTPSSFDQANSNYGAVLSVWDRLFGTYTGLSRAQHERIVFGVRELPRRECLKPSAMLLTPWRIPRAVTAR